MVRIDSCPVAMRPATRAPPTMMMEDVRLSISDDPRGFQLDDLLERQIRAVLSGLAEIAGAQPGHVRLFDLGRRRIGEPGILERAEQIHPEPILRKLDGLF